MIPLKKAENSRLYVKRRWFGLVPFFVEIERQRKEITIRSWVDISPRWGAALDPDSEYAMPEEIGTGWFRGMRLHRGILNRLLQKLGQPLMD